MSERIPSGLKVRAATRALPVAAVVLVVMLLFPTTSVWLIVSTPLAVWALVACSYLAVARARGNDAVPRRPET